MNLATEERQEQEAVQAGKRATRLGGTDIFRGALVIVTAIVIGGFIISRGLDAPETGLSADTETTSADPAAPVDGEAETDGGEVLPDAAADGQAEVTAPPVDQETTVPPVVEETPVETTVPEVPAARTPAEVKVLVLNGAQTQGIAARGTEALKAASYLTGAPKNATTQMPSAILYEEGYELDAQAVAAVFTVGLEGLVQPIDPTNIPIDDTQGSNVIVVIGNDDVIPIP